MSELDQDWYPGSFTKNFGWGKTRRAGLAQLHKTIRAGFGDEEADVSREVFRTRTAQAGLGDYIPVNFFLFNRTINGTDYIVFDELVFQAVTAPHSANFDRLALFVFNFSYVGRWARARKAQKRPALWAFHYIQDVVAKQRGWDTSSTTADDIERYVKNDPRYRAETARKLATNLNYLYKLGRLDDFANPRVERWWVDALFLALDRLIEDRAVNRLETSEGQYSSLLSGSGFSDISGKRSLEKDFAIPHLVNLYRECGGRDRFTAEHVRERTLLRLPDLQWYIANDDRPQGAVHPSNPRILKSIPRACAMLARYAGFDVIDADELLVFDPKEFVKTKMQQALKVLQDKKIEPTISAEELMRITRDR